MHHKATWVTVGSSEIFFLRGEREGGKGGKGKKEEARKEGKKKKK
jgi:hypothetical protein